LNGCLKSDGWALRGDLMKEKGGFFRYFGARSKFVYYNSLSETHPDIYGKLIAEK
jgi:hypothetical protein